VASSCYGTDNRNSLYERHRFNFADRGNLTLFMQKAAAAGLFVNLRIGPYVCAEWTYGGLPAWLGQVGVCSVCDVCVWCVLCDVCGMQCV